MNRISFEKPRKNLGGYSWLLMIDSLTKKRKQIQQRRMLVLLVFKFKGSSLKIPPVKIAVYQESIIQMEVQKLPLPAAKTA
jgi:hypothetical protein